MKVNGIAESRAWAIFETICSHGAGGEVFTTGDIESSLVKYDGWKLKTAQIYFNKFAKWAVANPDVFSGPKSQLTRVGYGQWKLTDNPER